MIYGIRRIDTPSNLQYNGVYANTSIRCGGAALRAVGGMRRYCDRRPYADGYGCAYADADGYRCSAAGRDGDACYYSHAAADGYRCACIRAYADAGF